MGIYDREYYRREGPSFLDSLTNWGRVCKWLIAVNVVCFVMQVVTAPRQPGPGATPDDYVRFLHDVEKYGPYGWFTATFILDTEKVLEGQVWRLLTGAFLHDTEQIFHIVFNMLFLWWFGTRSEDLYGHREFLTFYLIAAICGNVAFVLAHLKGGLALGASGAVTAVLVLYACHFPREIIYFFGLVPVPVWLFVGIQVAQDTLVFVSNAPTRVGVSAHLGGAAFGFAYYKLHLRLTNLLPDFRGWLRTRARTRSRPQLRVFREEEETPTPVSVPSGGPRPEAEEQLEAKLDAVLEKVARHGQASLTESERQILFRASEVYKRRRT